MRVIEREIYNFNELTEEVQEKLIEKERENILNDYIYYYLEDDMIDEGKKLLNEYLNGAILDSVEYDLSYSQGSGAMIEFTINFEDINKIYNIVSDEELRFITDKSIINNIEVKHNDNMYYHEYTFCVDYYNYLDQYDFEDVKDDYKITKEEFYSLGDRIDNCLYGNGSNLNHLCAFRQDIVIMNKEFTKKGYELIENARNTDVGFIKDSLNDFEYYGNGDVYYEK